LTCRKEKYLAVAIPAGRQMTAVKRNVSAANIIVLVLLWLLALLISMKITNTSKPRKRAEGRAMLAAVDPKIFGAIKIEVGPSAPPVIEIICNG